MSHLFCPKHKCAYVSYFGYMKCPECNWEQAASLSKETLSLCEHGYVIKFNNCVYCNLLKAKDEDIELDKYKSLIDSLNARRNDWKECLPQIDSLIEINKSLLERIEKLENAYKADFETAKEIIFAGAQTHASIIRCEAKIKSLECFESNVVKYDNKMSDRITKLENSDYDERISDIEKIGAELRLIKLESRYSKKPYKCPVCDGEGGVKHPLTGLVAPATCNACEGKGIVWSN